MNSVLLEYSRSGNSANMSLMLRAFRRNYLNNVASFLWVHGWKCNDFEINDQNELVVLMACFFLNFEYQVKP